ncbi:MAG TPA: XkdF-like putative serine protease domain-containing protein [Armatimonadota bacterium]|jgi:hypothetical protein
MVKRIVYGEVLAPDEVDQQGDVVRAGEIEAAAHRFLTDGGAVGAMHSSFDGVGRVVESFVAREGDPLFAPGAWVLGVQLGEEAWRRVQDGDWTGFSVGGRAVRVPAGGGA